MSEQMTEAMPVAVDGRQAEALSVVNGHMAVSAGVGLLPFPLLDIAAITGVQIRMLYKISGIYDVPFSKNLAKSLVSSLLGGALPAKAAWGATGSLVKAIPGVGTYLGWVTMPALAGAATYAVGRIFIEHFESGGTFLTFNPQTSRDRVRAHMAAAPSAKPASEAAKSGAEPASDAEPAVTVDKEKAGKTTTSATT